MNLQFKVYRLKQESETYKRFNKEINEFNNNFIIIGETKDVYMTHNLTDSGLLLINGLDLEECSFLVPKKEMELVHGNCSFMITELNIPKDKLNIDLVDNILRLNS